MPTTAPHVPCAALKLEPILCTLILQQPLNNKITFSNHSTFPCNLSTTLTISSPRIAFLVLLAVVVVLVVTSRVMVCLHHHHQLSETLPLTCFCFVTSSTLLLIPQTRVWFLLLFNNFTTMQVVLQSHLRHHPLVLVTVPLAVW